MYVCMYVMHACMHVCMYVGYDMLCYVILCYVSMYVCINVSNVM